MKGDPCATCIQLNDCAICQHSHASIEVCDCEHCATARLALLAHNGAQPAEHVIGSAEIMQGIHHLSEMRRELAEHWSRELEIAIHDEEKHLHTLEHGEPPKRDLDQIAHDLDESGWSWLNSEERR